MDSLSITLCCFLGSKVFLYNALKLPYDFTGEMSPLPLPREAATLNQFYSFHSTFLTLLFSRVVYTLHCLFALVITNEVNAVPLPVAI